jgi:hypothetical protein
MTIELRLSFIGTFAEARCLKDKRRSENVWSN